MNGYWLNLIWESTIRSLILSKLGHTTPHHSQSSSYLVWNSAVNNPRINTGRNLNELNSVAFGFEQVSSSDWHMGSLRKMITYERDKLMLSLQWVMQRRTLHSGACAMSPLQHSNENQVYHSRIIIIFDPEVSNKYFVVTEMAPNLPSSLHSATSIPYLFTCS
jgi:hypothetical protein